MKHQPNVTRTIDVSVSESGTRIERSRHRTVIGGEERQWIEISVVELDSNGDASHRSDYRPDVLLGAWEANTAPPFEPPPVRMKSRMIARAVATISRLLPPPNTSDETSTESNRRLVARYVEEFKNQQRFHVFPVLFSHDFRHHFEFAGQPDTAASFVNVGVNLLDAFPDVHVEILHLLVEGDLVVEHNLVTAHHSNPWAGYEATGKRVEWNEVHFYRIAGGRIVENWPYVDFNTLADQLAPNEAVSDAKTGSHQG